MLHDMIIKYEKMLNLSLLRKTPVRYFDAVDLWVKISETDRILAGFDSKLQIKDRMFWSVLLLLFINLAFKVTPVN